MIFVYVVGNVILSNFVLYKTNVSCENGCFEQLSSLVKITAIGIGWGGYF